MSADDKSLAENLPEIYWGIDPLLKSSLTMYIDDVLNMPQVDGHPGVFTYGNHHICSVDILGVIVRVDKRNKAIVYDVDDSTGVIRCTCWQNCEWEQKPGVYDELSRLIDDESLKNKLRQVSEMERCAAEDGFELGQLLNVVGNISIYQGINEINATRHAVVNDPMVEIDRMAKLPILYRQFYDRVFTLPAGLKKKKTLSNEQKLSEMILRMIERNRIELLHSKDLILEKNLASMPAANDKETCQKVFESLELSGDLCRHPVNEGEYVVIDYSHQLHKAVIDIIRRGSNSVRDGYNGCHFMYIHRELRKLLPYSQINRVSLVKCLTLLENRSDIISTTGKHYIVV